MHPHLPGQFLLSVLQPIPRTLPTTSPFVDICHPRRMSEPVHRYAISALNCGTLRPPAPPPGAMFASECRTSMRRSSHHQASSGWGQNLAFALARTHPLCLCEGLGVPCQLLARLAVSCEASLGCSTGLPEHHTVLLPLDQLCTTTITMGAKKLTSKGTRLRASQPKGLERRSCGFFGLLAFGRILTESDSCAILEMSLTQGRGPTKVSAAEPYNQRRFSSLQFPTIEGWSVSWRGYCCSDS